jgi:hypothetical protein
VVHGGQDIEMAVDPVPDRIGVQRFRQKDEIPLLLPGLIDDVLPGLRRQPLGEVSANTGQPVAGKVQPVGQEVSEIVPDAFDFIIVAVLGVEVGIEQILLVEGSALPGIAIVGFGSKRGIVAKKPLKARIVPAVFAPPIARCVFSSRLETMRPNRGPPLLDRK